MNERITQILGMHGHYQRFLDFGDAQDYEARQEAFRVALRKEPVNR
jgi:hypothetical protein